MIDEPLRRELEQLAAALDGRVEIWRLIVDVDGHEIRRIYRGSFSRPRTLHDVPRRGEE